MGWENNFPDGGRAGAVVYDISSMGGWPPSPSWPYGEGKRLHPGEGISVEVDWYYTSGMYLTPRVPRGSYEIPYPRMFDLVVSVNLDVDEDYIREHFRHMIPGLPGVSHRIKAFFDV